MAWAGAAGSRTTNSWAAPHASMAAAAAEAAIAVAAVPPLRCWHGMGGSKSRQQNNSHLGSKPCNMAAAAGAAAAPQAVPIGLCLAATELAAQLGSIAALEQPDGTAGQQQQLTDMGLSRFAAAATSSTAKSRCALCTCECSTVQLAYFIRLAAAAVAAAARALLPPRHAQLLPSCVLACPCRQLH